MSVFSCRFSVLAVLLSAMALVFFLPGLSGDFIFDDKPNIVTNTSVHVADLSSESLLYAAYSFQPGDGSRALVMLTFALDYWRGGLNPEVFKSTNLLIHGLTILALALFFRVLLSLVRWSPRGAIAGALVLAAVWGIHPLQVSSVLYVVQRMQTLGTLFLVLALLAYLMARRAQISGGRSRLYWTLALLAWVLALACKEDSVLLPAYALALELTVLRFQAGSERGAKRLRQCYGVFTLLGVLIFFLVIVPHYWHWQAPSGRDFSTPERLLTQGRVLVMYLTQVLVPLPSSMPFYYDDIEVSRGWLHPVSTVWSWAVVVALLAVAWFSRLRRPLFALGCFLFFLGHFISSNVINLELAFEHRNHFPLIGAVLAVGDLFVVFLLRWAIVSKGKITLLAVSLLVLGGATAARAYSWGEPIRFAKMSLGLVPKSERAWLDLCTRYFDLSHEAVGSPYMSLSIETCQRGADATGSAALLSNVVIFKTIQGSVVQQDWDNLLVRLREVPMSAQNRKIIWTTLDNVERKVPLDERGVLEVIDVISGRVSFAPNEYLRIAAYIFNETHQPRKAFPYLQRAVELSPLDDPDIQKMYRELTEVGRKDWVDRLMQVQQSIMQGKKI